jgi:hypothetical protein
MAEWTGDYIECTGGTRPRLLAHRNEWHDTNPDHESSVCCEIGTGGPLGGNTDWHHVGETANKKKRMSHYGRRGSHLSKMIDYHLRQGWQSYTSAHK